MSDDPSPPLPSALSLYSGNAKGNAHATRHCTTIYDASHVVYDIEKVVKVAQACRPAPRRAIVASQIRFFFNKSVTTSSRKA